MLRIEEFRNRMSKTQKKKNYIDDIKRLLRNLENKAEEEVNTEILDFVYRGLKSNDIQFKDFKSYLSRNRNITNVLKNDIYDMFWRQKPSLYILFEKRSKRPGDNKYLERAQHWDHLSNVYEVLAIIGSGTNSCNMFFEEAEVFADDMNSPFSFVVGEPISKYYYDRFFNEPCTRPNVYDTLLCNIRLYADVVTEYDLYKLNEDTCASPLTANFTVK